MTLKRTAITNTLFEEKINDVIVKLGGTPVEIVDDGQLLDNLSFSTGMEALVNSISGGGGASALTEDEMFEVLLSTNILFALMDNDNSILTDQNGFILQW